MIKRASETSFMVHVAIACVLAVVAAIAVDFFGTRSSAVPLDVEVHFKRGVPSTVTGPQTVTPPETPHSSR